MLLLLDVTLCCSYSQEKGTCKFLCVRAPASVGARGEVLRPTCLLLSRADQVASQG